MKALTNILTQLLMLQLLMLVACTEDTAEVDDLVRGEEYVQVRMHVPGMKNATTRADEAEDNLTSVVVLVFRNDALVSKTEVTTASSTLTTTNTTGTFNIPRPKSEDVIHFLGNLPETVKKSLPATGGTQEDVLRGLITDDDENLSYWGTATYTSGDVIDNVTLYRNMAKIEIAAGDECTFPKDQLFIVGLVNANQVGALVPCNEEGTFGYRDEPTLPESPSPKTDEDARPLVTSLYVFEHENPGTANGLYVICKIEDDYYKVALIDEDKEPYPIIRNHRYVIYVNDLDYGADGFDIAADPETKPCNFAKVTFTNTSDKTLYWNDGSPTSFDVEMTGVPDGKNVTLSITGAAAFTITLPNGETVSDTYIGGNTTFTIKPKDKNSVSDAAYTIGFSGTGNGINVVPAEVSVTVKASSSALFATSGTINMDNSETSTTITLTKPTNVQNIKVTFDANTFIINDNQGHTSNDYWINNNSNSTIDIKFTIRNNNVAAGTYNVTFTDDGQMAATATITIKKTPTVSFSNTSDKTLYWNNNNPTSFDVEMTGVPDGKDVTLSITNASAFTITLPNGDSVSDTYTGGNTTFTIKPKDANSVRDAAYSIGFSGTGDGVIVPNTSISVKVEATKPNEIIIWEGNIKFVNWGEDKCYVEDKAKLSNIVAGVKLNLYLTANGDNTNVQLFYEWNTTAIYNGNVNNGKVTIDVDETIANNINNNRIIVQGNNCTLTKITVPSQ